MTNEGPYAYTRNSVLNEFSNCVQGSTQALFVALSTTACSEALHEAVEKSARALGYAEGATWVYIDSPTQPLDESSLLSVVEGLDPRCVLTLGSNATQLFATTYRIDAESERSNAWGRPVCLIPHAEQLMENEKGKQRLWSLVKSLPHL